MANLRNTRNNTGILAATIATWLLITFTGVCGLEIKTLKVPSVVQLGSKDPLILDCDYVYEEKEKSDLVIKWYRDTREPSGNTTSQQVYQWITTFKPQDLGILKGRLDILHEASDDPYSKYRALYIKKPNVDITGEYRCHVSSNFNDAWKSQRMVVYSPAKEVWLNQNKIDGSHANISCGAQGLFPEPTAELLIYRGKNFVRKVSDTSVYVSRKNGLYDIVAYKLFNDEKINSKYRIECEITVPETTYSTRKSIQYFTGEEGGEDSDEASEAFANIDGDSNERSSAIADDKASSSTTLQFYTLTTLILTSFISMVCSRNIL